MRREKSECDHQNRHDGGEELFVDDCQDHETGEEEHADVGEVVDGHTHNSLGYGYVGKQVIQAMYMIL